MIESTAAYKAAVVGTVRRTYVQAAVGIIDPDIEYDPEWTSTTCPSPYSSTSQLYDGVFTSGDTVMAIEKNRVILDGSFTPYQGKDVDTRQVGYVSTLLSDSSGEYADYAPDVWVEFTGVELIQAITIQFSDKYYDGVGVDFDISCGDTTISITGNRSPRVTVENLSEANPTYIYVYVYKWSMPDRACRIIEVYPGLYEEWTLDDLYTLSITQQTNFASTALPYGTCQLSVDNSDRRFEPSNPEGIFRSIEERQGVDISIGVELASGEIEYKKIGKYYQYARRYHRSAVGARVHTAGDPADDSRRLDRVYSRSARHAFHKRVRGRRKSRDKSPLARQPRQCGRQEMLGHNHVGGTRRGRIRGCG